MNYRLILRLLGNVFKIEAAFMVLPSVISFVYKENDTSSFLFCILILTVLGCSLMSIKTKENTFTVKDAFAATTIAWFLFSFFGALPFYFSGYFNSFIDCLFESISGFTTTGATILCEIESLPHGILFWRSFSQWIGAMGVLIFLIAVLPSMNSSSINLFKAESTGITSEKIVPKIRDTAKIMYSIYLIFTAVTIIALITTGLPIYDSFVNGFSIAGTGGFSNMNQSMGAYNNVAAEIVASIFMFLSGIRFSLYFYLLKRNFRQIFQDEELRIYFWVVLFSIIFITVNISGIYESVWQSIRYSSFQVISTISTSGFATADFNLWPVTSKIVLMFLLFTGCCAGSTGGGIKLIRIILLIKTARNEIYRSVNFRNLKEITINGEKIKDENIMKTAMFFFIYFMVFFISVLIVSIENKDLISTVTAVMAMLSNVGPGLGIVGPAGNFSSFSPLSKIVFSFCMIVGRLEFFPVLILLSPFVTKRTS